jgi:hypothetical protein
MTGTSCGWSCVPPETASSSVNTACSVARENVLHAAFVLLSDANATCCRSAGRVLRSAVLRSRQGLRATSRGGRAQVRSRRHRFTGNSDAAEFSSHQRQGRRQLWARYDEARLCGRQGGVLVCVFTDECQVASCRCARPHRVQGRHSLHGRLLQGQVAGPSLTRPASISHDSIAPAAVYFLRARMAGTEQPPVDLDCLATGAGLGVRPRSAPGCEGDFLCLS